MSRTTSAYFLPKRPLRKPKVLPSSGSFMLTGLEYERANLEEPPTVLFKFAVFFCISLRLASAFASAAFFASAARAAAALFFSASAAAFFFASAAFFAANSWFFFIISRRLFVSIVLPAYESHVASSSRQSPAASPKRYLLRRPPRRPRPRPPPTRAVAQFARPGRSTSNRRRAVHRPRPRRLSEEISAAIAPIIRAPRPEREPSTIASFRARTRTAVDARSTRGAVVARATTAFATDALKLNDACIATGRDGKCDAARGWGGSRLRRVCGRTVCVVWRFFCHETRWIHFSRATRQSSRSPGAYGSEASAARTCSARLSSPPESPT